MKLTKLSLFHFNKEQSDWYDNFFLSFFNVYKIALLWYEYRLASCSTMDQLLHETLMHRQLSAARSHLLEGST